MVIRYGDMSPAAAKARRGPPPPTPFKYDALRWLIGYGIAALIAYFTTISTLNAGLVQITEREKNHFEQLKGMLEMLQNDMRDVRARQR